MCFWRGGVSAANPYLLTFSQMCPKLATFWLFNMIWRYRAPAGPCPGGELYNSDVPYSVPLCIHCKSAAFRHLPYFFSKSDLYESCQIDTDTQMYLCPSALIFCMEWDFSLGHMSMDLSSVLAALSSHGVLLVTGTNIQVAARNVGPGS